jgi:bifunctional non-homologous end joining protein LigD
MRRSVSAIRNRLCIVRARAGPGEIHFKQAILRDDAKQLVRTLHPDPRHQVPTSKSWLHEVKHDGYRLIVHREGKRVRLFTRNGFDWSDKYPLITEAALRIRSTSFVLDGEAVLLGVDGISDFDGLHSRKHNDEVQFLRL